MISKDKIGKLASRRVDKQTDLAVSFRSFYYQPADSQPVITPQLAHHFVKPPVIHSIGSSLKDTGTLYFTRTRCSFCLPGIHLGMPLTTLKASASRAASTARSTLKSDSEPSFSTMKLTITHPSFLAFCKQQWRKGRNRCRPFLNYSQGSHPKRSGRQA